jgi:hypothetical protein
MDTKCLQRPLDYQAVAIVGPPWLQRLATDDTDAERSSKLEQVIEELPQDAQKILLGRGRMNNKKVLFERVYGYLQHWSGSADDLRLAVPLQDAELVKWGKTLYSHTSSSTWDCPTTEVALSLQSLLRLRYLRDTSREAWEKALRSFSDAVAMLPETRSGNDFTDNAGKGVRALLKSGRLQEWPMSLGIVPQGADSMDLCPVAKRQKVQHSMAKGMSDRCVDCPTCGTQIELCAEGSEAPVRTTTEKLNAIVS